MNTLLNENTLRALKRAEIQKLAKREGFRANGKTDALIAALVAKYPGGILPLEKEKGPARRSKRLQTTEPKDEEEEVAVEPPVFGDSISQYVPSRTNATVRATVETADEADTHQQQRAASPLPTPPPPSPSQRHEQEVPAPRPATPVLSLVKASSRGVRIQHSPPAVTPQQAPEFVQGSSGLVNNQAHALQRKQECLTTGAPTSAATRVPNFSRAREGASLSTEKLNERNIQLSPPKQVAPAPGNGPVFHPSSINGQAGQCTRAGPSRRIVNPQVGPASAFSLHPAKWSSPDDQQVPVVAESISEMMSRKRRRDELEDDELDADSAEGSDSESDASSVSQPTAGPSRASGYVPKPVPGYNGHESTPEPEYEWAERYALPYHWQSVRGDNLRPSPKRTRHR
ncbi:uncharacterized protein C8Q71DRAFT_72651 [Rhodofomes roseus]|uniref:Rho termination factor N-terminal domain-containing protein n=1 Tax=Rhodofomes roseus TaxID=34475 RepID=A0ABQ8KG73_9APHY|nr:uncharacterized protein C8Q71DRAFT_72651 [Rhodofomes roseus]KAH9836237.1 hypothetical protein C8Q71DRAFT_72651 [Rhodofomes roseus]